MGQVRVIYFLPKNHKLAVFEAKTSLQKQFVQPKLQTFFQIVFGWMNDQINSLTPYMGVCGFFLSVKFATSLLA